MNSTGTILAIYAVILLPFAGIMYYSNAKKKNKFNEMMNSLTVGQKIMTVGGIIGTITKLDTETVEIKVDQNARLTITKRAVSRIIN
ncbi:preprotein translocase subunit YajC [Streptobacillus canis]|uniref:preprotein translocase subunit YajC n=1 Tax=Streptobacillus canis TaxID=2678686 RepID=UPI0012E10FD6|nr:preprotein translocase subunit YajC [Streptobacillus canis]